MSSNSVQQIRPVIECFCQILSLYGFSSVTPEIFRLAKFNRNEATIPLWRLIFEILHFDPIKPNQQQTSKKFDQTPKDELVYMIKNDLFTRGYTYEYFLSLDSKMEKGSRQLLLCLGWLIYHAKVIDKCMEACLNSDSLLDYDDTSSLYQIDQIECVKYSSQEKDLIGQVKQAMHLNSKLRFSLRRLYGLIIENTNLQHQIHECHNMSSLEAYLCQHPHLLSHYMIEMENEQQKLNFFLFWNEHENVFWKWMESVLDQPILTDENEEDDNEDKYEPLRQIDCKRLEAEKEKFHSAIDTLDNALVRLQQLWISSNDPTSIEQDVSSLLVSIDDKVSLLFNQLLTTNPSTSTKSPSTQSLFLHQPNRLVYTKKIDSNDNNHFIKSSDLDHETKSLNKLQTNINQHIEKQRTILDKLSHQFQNVMIV
ncbi:unnamed protein product [Adineta steineri]|uniref:Tubulin epsilon and delta complex protein 1 domain-containing protein n=1 Tax=Adineta steineri TaxID=433720 RepID=A0A815Y0U7_9BILA|nr:unnamed protein product [Adineta steineri]CAF1315711.1 unnamed protein product [Adineta steineri]CAF1562739.1 unnamed protein product [Adineta steineri]CAF1564439.1 unnamed protein product [Adineta steineri]